MFNNLNLKIIKKAILKKKVVSFDVFDTLVCRNCLNPNDVFYYVEKKYNSISNKKIVDFKAKRLEAYYQAKKTYGVEEATLDQIYEFIDDKYDKKLLHKLEMETQIDFCVANKSAKELYLYAKENRKRIICISDMYLDSKTIKKILENCGYEIDEIYVSSEYKKQKKTKSLFKELMSLGVFNSKDIVHIGDAEKVDYLYPKLLGIKTCLFTCNKKTTFLSQKDVDLSSYNNRLIYSLLINNNSSNWYYNFGYEVLGPICLFFCIWIHIKFDDQNHKKLFCARDMEMIYDMYNKLFPSDNNLYFYVSRRSLRLPYLYIFNNFGSFLSSITDNKQTLSDILTNLNLSNNSIKKSISDISKIDLEKKYTYNELINSDELKKIYNKVLKESIEKQGKKQFENFDRYIKNMQIDDFYLIDIGWRCTTQSILSNIYKEKNIKGLYFGINQGGSLYKNINGNNAEGYLFNKKTNYVKEANLKIHSSMILFEKFFSSQASTTIKYRDKEPYYVFSSEKAKKEHSIELIQNGANCFVDDIIRYRDFVDNINSYEYIELLFKYFTNPNLKFAKSFGEILNDNIYVRKLASPRSLIYYLIHPNKFKDDIGQSGWKIGFMKRLFKIQLPYYDIWKKAYYSKKKR